MSDLGPPLGERAADAPADEPPPILGRWSHLYALVVIVLLAIILALTWLTRSFE